ncbi:winged helix-turn-helix domain-containing protein [Thermus albus]|uniref:winged helix-turn-helix domain-containing protein n=1 Tax=Thermus albus TaxID=2908146 RepID=UPI001FA98CD3|nr:winged helix-turn-helix domain-containing protein [Thermus albus]
MKTFLSALLILAYTFALVMSTGHLSEWYRLTLGSLPGWFAVGLAAALEMSAFLLSLLSNSLLKGSRWASWGAVVALGLVWVGNWFSMRRAGEGIPEVEVFLSSLFVPVSTFVLAKVLGELLEAGARTSFMKATMVTEGPGGSSYLGHGRSPYLGHGRSPYLEASTLNAQDTPVTPDGEPVYDTGTARTTHGNGIPHTSTLNPVDQVGRLPRKEWRQNYLMLLETPRTAREIMETLGLAKPTVYKQLKILEREGLVRNDGGKWVKVRTYA